MRYLRRVFVAFFNLKKYLLHSEALSFRAFLVGISVATMAGLDVTTVMVCFELDATPVEIMGQAKMKEVFVVGMEKPALHITLNDLVTIKEGSTFGEASLRGDVLIIGSPMVLDEEQQIERMKKRPRELEDEEDEPLIFEHMK